MSDKQNEGFVRQRRNLMIASLVLLFSEATELKVEKISAFGTELLIGQPQAVTTALWVAAIYWLIRYYQYARAGYQGALRQAVQGRVLNTCAPAALKRLLREEPSLLTPIESVKVLPQINYSSTGVIVNETNFLEIELGLHKTATDERSSTIEVMSRRVRLDGVDLFLLKVRAFIHTILHTTLFTEVVLPYVVFAAPILYAVYKAVRQIIFF